MVATGLEESGPWAFVVHALRLRTEHRIRRWNPALPALLRLPLRARLLALGAAIFSPIKWANIGGDVPWLPLLPQPSRQDCEAAGDGELLLYSMLWGRRSPTCEPEPGPLGQGPPEAAERGPGVQALRELWAHLPGRRFPRAGPGPAPRCRPTSASSSGSRVAPRWGPPCKAERPCLSPLTFCGVSLAFRVGGKPPASVWTGGVTAVSPSLPEAPQRPGHEGGGLSPAPPLTVSAFLYPSENRALETHSEPALRRRQ